jgi:hypothetical protein
MKKAVILAAFSLLASSAVIAQEDAIVTIHYQVEKNGVTTSGALSAPIEQTATVLNNEIVNYVKEISISVDKENQIQSVTQGDIKTGYSLRITPTLIGKMIVLDVKSQFVFLEEMRKTELGVELPKTQESRIDNTYALLNGEQRLIYTNNKPDAFKFTISATRS